MTFGETSIENHRLEEFLVLEEGNEKGSPFREQDIPAGGVGDMEIGKIHWINIRKELVGGNQRSTYALNFDLIRHLNELRLRLP